MTLKEIQREVLSLSDRDRASLAADLLDTLPSPSSDQTDDDAIQRDRELESGTVEPISHEELVRRVLTERGQ